jgi:hypothetical protein
VKKLSHWVSEAVEHTIVETPPVTIAPALVDRKHSDQQPSTIFNSAYPPDGSLGNYAAKIWRAMARVLPGGRRGRAS